AKNCSWSVAGTASRTSFSVSLGAAGVLVSGPSPSLPSPSLVDFGGAGSTRSSDTFVASRRTVLLSLATSPARSVDSGVWPAVRLAASAAPEPTRNRPTPSDPNAMPADVHSNQPAFTLLYSV